MKKVMSQIKNTNTASLYKPIKTLFCLSFCIFRVSMSRCNGAKEVQPVVTKTDEELKPRKIPNQNIVYRLFQRETNVAKPGTHFHQSRKFYTNVFPNFTAVNVEKPPCFLRKFSPDGRYFIAFSSDQTSIEVYAFQVMIE